MRVMLVLVAALCTACTAAAEAPKISHSPRELGRVILREISVDGGRVVLRTDSNGCSQKTSFKVQVRKEDGFSAGIPHYRLSIDRILVDECKAIEWDGVQIEFDLVKDLGLRGAYTISIENPVISKEQESLSSPPAKAQVSLKKSLLQSATRAIGMEMDGCRARLKTAEAGTGPKENIEKFRANLDELESEQAKYVRMPPDDYPAPVNESPETTAVFDKSTPYGPVLPPVRRRVVGTVDETPKDGVLLSVEGMSRSGPFYHLAGIEGDDYRALKRGKRYQFDLCLVYRREYFGFIPDYYVYVSDMQ